MAVEYAQAHDFELVPFQITKVDDPEAVVVLQLGTLSEPEYGDLLAAKFKQRGITTYAVASRTRGADNFRLHAAGLEEVVDTARRDNPGVPITVMGVSLGAVTALEWNALHNRSGEVPVVAMSPVIMSRFSYLGPLAVGKIVRGLFLRRLRARCVDSPLSAGIQLTTNPASDEYQKVDRSKKVPVGLFDDVMMMLFDITMAASRNKSRLLIVQAGNDRVAYNAATTSGPASSPPAGPSASASPVRPMTFRKKPTTRTLSPV